jgi:hypothetical protein
MVDNFDGLVLFLLRTTGMGDAVLTYEEETGASHAEATTAVRKLARRNGLDHRDQVMRKVGMVLATAVTIGVVSFLVLMRSS